MTEKTGTVERYTNGDTNGDTQDEHAIIDSIYEEPVTLKRRAWVPPKDSKLLNPGVQSHLPSNHHPTTC